jgi:hypothetical protein
MVTRAMNQVRQYVAPATPHFTDVPTNHTFYAYVETAYAHFAMVGEGNGSFRVVDDIQRGEVADALFKLTTHERLFTHNSRYQGSNNWEHSNRACGTPVPVSPTDIYSMVVPGSQVGYSLEYGSYNSFAAMGREIQFDSDAKSYLTCPSRTLGLVFHAFNNPGGSGNCQSGNYYSWATNLPNPSVDYRGACGIGWFDEAEARFWTNSPSQLAINSPEYFAWVDWRPGGTTQGELNIDNYYLQSNGESVNDIGKDNMQKFCYKKGDSGTSQTGNEYGIYPCP